MNGLRCTRDKTGLGTWLPAPLDGDTELCLENNQSVDGDTGIILESDDGWSLKKHNHVTCLQKVNKAVWIGNHKYYLLPNPQPAFYYKMQAVQSREKSKSPGHWRK